MMSNARSEIAYGLGEDRDHALDVHHGAEEVDDVGVMWGQILGALRGARSPPTSTNSSPQICCAGNGRIPTGGSPESK
jgi:hypothetical protein